MKKIKYIISCGCLFLVLIFLIITLIAYKTDYSFNKFIINGYYDKKETYIDCGRDYTSYVEYYYNKKYDLKFIKNKNYNKINENNINKIKLYFEDFKNKVDFEIEIPTIDYEDFYFLKNEELEVVKEFHSYSLYFYDVDKHKLFYIHY